jgi:hypothetical protein
MRTISLKPVRITPAILSSLERRGLIRTLRPTARVLKTTARDGAVETLYASAPRFGTHKLLCVGKNATRIRLSAHSENEEFILLNPASLSFKPLYLIIGLYPERVLLNRIRKKTLCSGDFITLELEYNKYKTCFFVMRKGTVHCEVTLPVRGQHPVFFVTEPSRMDMRYLPLDGHVIEMHTRGTVLTSRRDRKR